MCVNRDRLSGIGCTWFQLPRWCTGESPINLCGMEVILSLPTSLWCAGFRYIVSQYFPILFRQRGKESNPMSWVYGIRWGSVVMRVITQAARAYRHIGNFSAWVIHCSDVRYDNQTACLIIVNLKSHPMGAY